MVAKLEFFKGVNPCDFGQKLENYKLFPFGQNSEKKCIW